MSKVTLSICKSRIQDPDVNKGVSLGCQKFKCMIGWFFIINDGRRSIRTNYD